MFSGLGFTLDWKGETDEDYDPKTQELTRAHFTKGHNAQTRGPTDASAAESSELPPPAKKLRTGK